VGNPVDPEAQPEVLTVPEAARLLRVSPKTVYALVAAQQIPGWRRLGRAIRFDRRALLHWLGQGGGASDGST
jgi:excisionase family DNA binding protein